MAARVTATDVKTLIDTDLEDAAIANQIAMATELVDAIASKDATITATRLKLIEMNLAAHFVAATVDPRTKSESASSVSQTFEGAFSESRYWANARKLDPTGTLIAMEKGHTGSLIIEAF